MKSEPTIEELLRWRLARAETEAPRPPRAADLLQLAQPWWETWPNRFQSLVERLGRIQVAYGHAMADPRQPHQVHPVPTLIVRAIEESETSARVLYFKVGDGRLRLRFQLEPSYAKAQEKFEVTFIADDSGRPLFSAMAVLSLENEYCVDAELSEELSRVWEQLKVTDRMPFRFILRTDNLSG
jgi:hypothetical protein